MATIVMNSKDVIAACTRTINKIKATRIERDEKTIARVMAESRREFPLFYKKYFPTEDQAIDILDKGGYFGWRSQYAGGDLDHAKKLLNLAKRGDPVTLNEEDCRVVFWDAE